MNARTFSNAFGAVYVIVGLVGFAVTGFSGFADTEGSRLLLFDINPLHNVVHLLIGAGLLAGASQGEPAARVVAGLIGAVYAVVGVLGFVVEGTAANLLALNTWDHLLHLATAGFAFVAIGVGRRPVASRA